MVERVFPGLDLYCTDPARNTSYRHVYQYDLDDVDDPDGDLSDVCDIYHTNLVFGTNNFVSVPRE